MAIENMGISIIIEVSKLFRTPLLHIRISNTSCSFLAFSKAKNAHMGRGSPIRINVWKSKSLTCKHDDSLISYIAPE